VGKYPEFPVTLSVCTQNYLDSCEYGESRLGSLKIRDHYIVGRLKLFHMEIKVGVVDWIFLVHDKNEWSVPADLVITLQAV